MFRRHLANRLVKLVLVLALAVYTIHCAYAQGVQHAIVTAQPSVVGDTIMINFGGQLHEYR